jgi:hypothetical protein
MEGQNEQTNDDLISKYSLEENYNLHPLPIGYEIKSGMGTGSRNLA